MRRRVPDEGQERLVRDALAINPWLRASMRRRIVMAAGYWLFSDILIGLFAWAVISKVHDAAVIIVWACVAAAVFAVCLLAIVIRPALMVRWSVLSTTSSDEDARKGFPGGGA